MQRQTFDDNGKKVPIKLTPQEKCCSLRVTQPYALKRHRMCIEAKPTVSFGRTPLRTTCGITAGSKNKQTARNKKNGRHN